MGRRVTECVGPNALTRRCPRLVGPAVPLVSRGVAVDLLVLTCSPVHFLLEVGACGFLKRKTEKGEAPDSPQLTHILKHLEFFDNISHDDLFECPNDTWTHGPRPLLSVYHEAKATVINELARPEHHDPNNPNATRLWKLLIHMDQLLLHTNKHPNPRQARDNATASQTATLAQ